MSKLNIDYDKATGSFRINGLEVAHFSVDLGYEDVLAPGDGDDDGTGDTGTGGDTGTPGDSTGGDNTGGDNTGGDNTGGDNTGGDNTGGDSTGGDSTGGDDTGSDTATTAIRLNDNAGLVADVDFTLAQDKAWSVGGWFRHASADSGDGFLLSTPYDDYASINISRYHSRADFYPLHLNSPGLQVVNKMYGVELGADWFFLVIANQPDSGKVLTRFAKPGATAGTVIYKPSHAFTADIPVTSWAIGQNVGAAAGGTPHYLDGAVSEQFVFTDQALSDDDVVAVANGRAKITDFGSPEHYWPLHDPADLNDQGSAGAPLSVTGGGLGQEAGPKTDGGDQSPDPGGGSGGSDDGSGSGSDSSGSGDDPGSGSGGTDTPAPPPEKTGVNITEATLVKGVSGKPVKVSASEDNGKTWTATVAPGKIVRLHDGQRLSWLTVNHIPEGGVTVGNDICDTKNDVVLKHLKVTAPDGRVLFNDALTIYARTHTRPWWYRQQKPVARPRFDLLPEWDAKATPHASQAGAYDYKTGRHDHQGNDYNGPMGSGMIRLDTGGTGSHPGIGPVPAWDAPYLVNPTADNARVVRGMADAMATYPLHARDPETLKMVDIRKYPKASVDWRFMGDGNPFKNVHSQSPFHLAQQDAHFPGFMIVSTIAFNTSYDREELAMSANYMQLTQNPGNDTRYRRLDKMMLWQTQTRAKAWGLRQMAAAATLVPEWSDYFKIGLDTTLSHIKQHFAHQSLPADRDDITAASNKVHSNQLPNYMNHYLITSIGMIIKLGHSDWQWAMDFFGRLPVAQLLDAPHELADWYHPIGRHDGKVAKNWAQCLDWTAKYGVGDSIRSRMVHALKQKEGTLAMIKAAKGDDASRARYRAGDFSRNPWNPDEGAAYLLCALAVVRQNGRVPRVEQAAAKAAKYARVEWGNTMHYNIKLTA